MLSVIILTYNESRHIERAIGAVRGIASEVFVIDSFSKDDTVALARSAGATVLQHPFVNYAKQYQWVLENAPITADWVMRLDADEIVEPDLAAEIAVKLPRLPADVTGINLKRKHIFMGRWIKHGGRYPLTLLRIWRRGKATIEDRWMDEHMRLTSGRAVTFDGGFADCNLNDLTYFIDKHNKYATREAVDVLNRRYHLFPGDAALTAEGSSRQAAFKRFAKERIYNRLPFWLGPLCYFLYRYFIQLGFLDGRPGLVYHFLQGFWYRFLVGAKVCELDAALEKVPADDRKAELAHLTGLEL
jgi:glycosyltransferase involved in cell wall biosynthesis